MPPFPKKYSTPSQVAVRVVLLRSCLSALYIHIKNVWVRTLMIDTPPTTSHAPPIHQRSHPWQLRRVTRPTLVVLWSVWTPTRATVTGTVRRWTDVRRWEKRRVKKLLPCHHTCSLFIFYFFGIASFFGWLPCTSHWEILCEIILYMFYIYFLFIFYSFFQTCATCFLSSFIFFYSPCLFSCIKTSTQIPRMCEPSQILTFDSGRQAASRSTKRT